MPTINVMTNCSKCQKKTLHIEQKMNHILHLLLSVVTAGVWIIVWIILAILHSNKPQCTMCGHNKGLINDTIAEIKNADNNVKEKKSSSIFAKILKFIIWSLVIFFVAFIIFLVRNIK